MNSIKDRYISRSGSNISPRIGIQHANNSDRSIKPSNSNNVLKATDRYTNSSNQTESTPLKSSAYNELLTKVPSLSTNYKEIPSLISNSETFEDDNSITDTALYTKFREAFELTLRNNPGILPSAPSVVDSVEKALHNLTKSRVDTEKNLREKISIVKKEKEEMEQRLNSDMGNLALQRNALKQELDALTKEKNAGEDSLKKQLEAVRAMKMDIQVRTEEASKEKEELTKHLGFLSKSRVELETALEKEMKLVEKDRDSLQKVIAERKSIQSQKMENKELESKIEIMTEAATKEKAALQAESEELRSFEAHLKKLKESNEITRQELEEEKRQLLEITRTLQIKKQAVTESKMDIEKGMQAEIEELEAQIENSRLLHSKDMENLVKNKVVKYLKRGKEQHPVEENDEDTEREHKDIESIVKARVEAELKAKEIETKERELALKEQEMKEREVMREREMEEKMMREMEVRERELRHEREEKEVREKEHKAKEERLDAMRKRRAKSNGRKYYSDDDDTLGDESTIQSEIQVRRTRSARSQSRPQRNKYRENDDDSTIASTENRKKRITKKQEETNTSKEDELKKELEELRKEIAKNKNEPTEAPREMDDMLKQRRETTGLLSSMRKYFSPQDELRGEIAALRDEIKMNHRDSPALRQGAAAAYPHQESRVYHESPGAATYSAPPREYHYESPGMASYASAPVERSHYDPERRSTLRRRYEDDEDAYLDNRHVSRSRGRGYEENYGDYERESRYTSGRFSSPGRVATQRSPEPRRSTSVMRSKYYL